MHDRSANPPPPAFTRQLVEALPRLRSRARHLARNQWAADDLVQDTVVKALARWTHFAPQTNFRAWVLMIMQNHFIDQRRAPRRHALTARPPEPYIDPDDEPVEVPLWQRFDADDVERATADLRPRYRKVATLVLLKGYSYREAAARLRSNDSTVGTQLCRARAHLRRLLIRRSERAGAASIVASTSRAA